MKIPFFILILIAICGISCRHNYSITSWNYQPQLSEGTWRSLEDPKYIIRTKGDSIYSYYAGQCNDSCSYSISDESCDRKYSKGDGKTMFLQMMYGKEKFCYQLDSDGSNGTISFTYTPSMTVMVFSKVNETRVIE